MSASATQGGHNKWGQDFFCSTTYNSQLIALLDCSNG